MAELLQSELRAATAPAGDPALTGDSATAGLAARLPWLVAGLLVSLVLAGSPNYRWSGPVRESPFAGDFLQEWLGGRLVLTGQREQFYDVAYAKALQHDPRVVGFAWDRSQYLPLVYPPFWYVAVSPLALLPFRVAAWVWAVLMTACLAAAVWAMSAATRASSPPEGGQRRVARAALWLAPLCMLFVPVLESLASGQKGTLCLLIFAMTYLLLKRERPLAAGMVFGLLAFKPQLALVIGLAMLAKRQWRFAGGAAMTACLLGLVSLTLGGDVCRQYVQFAGGAAEYARHAGYDLYKSHCLYGFFALLLGGPTTAAKLATVLAGVAVLVFLWQLLRGRLEAARPRFAWQWSGLVIASVLLSPHLFTYDLAVLLLPLWLIGAELLARPALRSPGWSAMLAALFVLPGISPAVAGVCGVQMTVPLLGAALWRLRGSSDGVGKPAPLP